jgi:hypothetical protein
VAGVSTLSAAALSAVAMSAAADSEVQTAPGGSAL